VHDVQYFEEDTVDFVDDINHDNHTNKEEALDTRIYDHMDVQYGSRSGRYSLRPWRPCDLGQLHHLVHERLKNFSNQRMMGYNRSHVVWTQYHTIKGLKVFGESGEEAVATELRHVHVRYVLDPSELSTQEEASALEYLMFLNEKNRRGKRERLHWWQATAKLHD